MFMGKALTHHSIVRVNLVNGKRKCPRSQQTNSWAPAIILHSQSKQALERCHNYCLDMHLHTHTHICIYVYKYI